jgi:hypothetical protein
MKIDITFFRKYKGDVLELYEDSHLEELGLYCATFGLPIIAALTFIREEYDDNRVEEKIGKLIEFYGYTEIVDEV